MIRYLVENGADILKKNKNRESPLSITREKGNNDNEILKFLLDRLGKQRDDGETLLTFSCKYKGNERIKKIINYGIDVNISNTNGDTPLTIACKKGNIEIVKYLIEIAHAKISTKDIYGNSPLIIACFFMHDKIAKYLINKIRELKLDLNMRNHDNYSPLTISKYFNNLSIKNYLIENGANENESENIIKPVTLEIDSEKNYTDINTKFIIKDIKSINNIPKNDQATINTKELELPEGLEFVKFNQFKKMEHSICKIETGTGFFIKFPIPWGNNNTLNGIITNNHVLNSSQLTPGTSITISVESTHTININDSIFIFTSELIDVTFIQLSDEKINEINPCFLTPNDTDSKEGDLIYILQHPLGGELLFKPGIIKKIHGIDYLHAVTTYFGSSGSPLINNDLKVTGVHKGFIDHNNTIYNVATRLSVVKYALYTSYNRRNIIGIERPRLPAKELSTEEIEELENHGLQVLLSNDDKLFICKESEKLLSSVLFCRTNHAWYWTTLLLNDFNKNDIINYFNNESGIKRYFKWTIINPYHNMLFHKNSIY